MQKQDQDREASIPLQSMQDREQGGVGGGAMTDDDGFHSPNDTLEIKLEPSRTFSTPAQPKKINIPAWLIIPIWMACSVSVILYNKYIFTSLKFKYPIFLTTWHLLFSAIGTRVLQRTTTLLDSVKDIDMPREKWTRTILPIGVLFSGSLILSNYAYLTLSVSFIQMLKAFNPVVILLISFAFRLQEPNKRLVGVVAMISFGCCTAAYGEVNFELVGFVCQCLALCFEASRLVMIEILLHGMKMDPLVSLYYYAPVCAALNFVLMLMIEGVEPFYHLERVGAFVLLTNAGVAFALNVAAVFLIAVGSGLILTLAGVLKDILLISGSVLAFGSSITIIQVFGYTVALAGLVLFKTGGAKK